MTVAARWWRALLFKQYARETCLIHPNGTWEKAPTVREAIEARRRLLAQIDKAAGKTP